MIRTKEDYEEWKHTMVLMYSKTSHLVDAVWDQFHDDAQRDGYVDFLEADEDDVTDIIETMIRDAT